MSWYIVQNIKDNPVEHSKFTCFVIKACTDLWHTHRIIVDELQTRGYLNCSLIQCSEEEMLSLTSDGGPYKRKRLAGMGPFECISLEQGEVEQIFLLLHITEKYQVVRYFSVKEETHVAEIMRGSLRGLSGKVVKDRANLRKFIPREFLPGVRLLVLFPAMDLKPLTKTEYESLRLKIDTSAKWYMVLCKNERILKQAFRLSVRAKTQEGIVTQDLSLEEFKSSMEYPQGISQRRYYYHVGSPFSKNLFFVFTTLADVQGCRARNPYAGVGLVWSTSYQPVSLNQKDFKQLVDAVEGKQADLSEPMKKFVEGLKTGDDVGLFLNNFQKTPIPAQVLKKNKSKLLLLGKDGRQYVVDDSSILPPGQERK